MPVCWEDILLNNKTNIKNCTAKMNHPVVMSPNSFAYVDLYQGNPIAEAPTYGMLRLSQSYKFDPVPTGVDPKYILGGQANLWSERLNTIRRAEHMLRPRAFAIAESLWSPQEKKNWYNFVQRVEKNSNVLISQK